MKNLKMDDGISKKKAQWDFSNGVSKTFVSHIKKSVPFYEEAHDLVCYLTDYFCHHKSTCYELGSSTGELIKKMAMHNSHKPSVNWVGIDNEPEMIQASEKTCKGISNVSFLNEDVLTTQFETSDLIVAYYTVQFIPEKARQELINRIYQSLNWGGAFILFEKVRGPDARFQDILTGLYQDFKKRNGFSSDEILNKSESLRGVLNPFSTQGNLDLLTRAGFKDIMPVYKYMCFEGTLCIK